MTVSKVLHDKGANVRVSVKTAERVRDVATRMGYQPNNLARSFRTKRTDTIGLVYEYLRLEDNKGGYFLALVAGATRAAFEHELSITICPKLVRQSEKNLVMDGRFDGLLWCTVPTDTMFGSRMSTPRFPVVFLHAPQNSLPGHVTSCCDNKHGLELAVQHLAELGHKKIAFVIDPYNARCVEGIERQTAFESSCVRLGIGTELLTWEEECLFFGEWVTTPGRATAMITFSEVLGGNVLALSRHAGVKVPDELSLIAYDSTFFCDLSEPKLTAISQPVEQMAYEAIKRLFFMINGRDRSAEHLSYPCGLDIRESTACPPQSRGVF